MEEKEKAADTVVEQQENQKVAMDCIITSAHKHLTFIALQEGDEISRKENSLTVDCLISKLINNDVYLKILSPTINN